MRNVGKGILISRSSSKKEQCTPDRKFSSIKLMKQAYLNSKNLLLDF